MNGPYLISKTEFAVVSRRDNRAHKAVTLHSKFAVKAVIKSHVDGEAQWVCVFSRKMLAIGRAALDVRIVNY